VPAATDAYLISRSTQRSRKTY